MSREDQYDVTVTIAGTPTGTWDKLTGFDMDSEETKYPPGGMQDEVSLGGRRMVTNGTVSRLYRLDRDRPLVALLEAQRGKGDVIVSKQSLDVDGFAVGSPIVFRGKLKTVKLPDADSTSNNPALVEIEVSAASTVVA